jgi:hypothetical protein
MTYQVISAFIDKRTGRQIDAGEDVPGGLDRETIARLVAANCLRSTEPETTAPVPNQPAGSAATGASDLFAGDAGDGQAGDPGAPDGNAATGEAPAADASAPAGGSAPSARRMRRSAAGGAIA